MRSSSPNGILKPTVGIDMSKTTWKCRKYPNENGVTIKEPQGFGKLLQEKDSNFGDFSYKKPRCHVHLRNGFGCNVITKKRITIKMFILLLYVLMIRPRGLFEKCYSRIFHQSFFNNKTPAKPEKITILTS
jgi:hypothetical protein